MRGIHKLPGGHRRKKRELIVKKRQLIRESDFKNLPGPVIEAYNVDFKPLTKDYFEKRATFFYLKNKKYVGDQYALSDYPKDMIKRFTGIHLYKRQYSSWLIKYNSQGELVIRAGLRQPESRLGLATFRKKK
jgi:hypothetical protein